MKIIRILTLVIITVVAVWGASAAVKRNQIIVVHTGESKTLLWNPATHEEVRNETADGNMMLTVQPKDLSKERER